MIYHINYQSVFNLLLNLEYKTIDVFVLIYLNLLKNQIKLTKTQTDRSIRAEWKMLRLSETVFK